MPISMPILSAVPEIAAALGRAPATPLEVVGAWGSAKTLAAVQTARALGRPLLILARGRHEAEAIHDDLCTFAGEEASALLPAWEVLPDDTMAPADDIVAERMNTLQRLADAQESASAHCAVMPVRSFLQYVIPPGRLMRDRVVLAVGDDHAIEDLPARLVKMGYVREVMVEHRGDFSVRGGILDVFPISAELPFRVEFFGDEIESIRRFEPETQRSLESVDRIDVLPRSEKTLLSALAEAGELAPVTAYFPKNTLIAVDEPVAIREEADLLLGRHGETPFLMPWDQAERAMAAFPRLLLAQLGLDAAPDATRLKMPTRGITGWAGQTNDFWGQLEQWNLEGYTVQLLCVNAGERRRLLELLDERGYRLGKTDFDLRVDIGRLQSGFTVPGDKFAILSEREMFGRHYMRRSRRRFEAGAAVTQFGDLKSGDYIVHETHGIGRYLGLRRFEGRPGDYLILQYAAGDVLYVPVTGIDQIQKYAGGDGALPKVDRLGGSTWQKKKARVKKAVKDMTVELVKLYAAREAQHGHTYPPDTPWQAEFEDAFEYDETPDQLRAIQDVKRDMESPRPMDRLVCGDVGYGKTEVALRAAFKAVMDGKQVALLAPTTVLAQQHFNTFSERLADFPIRLELLNRFRTAKQSRESIQRIKAGEADVIIGTHRLLSKDVGYKDLGLVVVDEEQRFGVGHKERLKQLRASVDVITLTATPIPRTLHFSLIGIRDMSVINTAPNDRLPIHTCIEAWDEHLIREAIERELGRQGQVFFLHNRVQTIEKTAALIQRLVPRARIATGHGQMEKHQLEEVMLQFVNREVDVLVCTTIIGSGIDIPNANTIIVDRADTFGLAELYQIRGRVGRYKHRAFAYLLVPGDKSLSEEAQQRLKALEDFSSLGSGFRIAMRDLEIRGCGNILGAEQSGNIQTVGYETFRELIEEAVAEARGAPVRRANLPGFDLAIDAHIPDEYIPTASQKMAIYRRIAAAKSLEEVDDLADELKDRFGAPPAPVKRLLEVMRARGKAAEVGAQALRAAGGVLSVEFEGLHLMPRAAQAALRRAFGDAISVASHPKPAIQFRFDPAVGPAREAIALLEVFAEGLDEA